MFGAEVAHLVRAQARHLLVIQCGHDLGRQRQAQGRQVHGRDAGTQARGLGQLVVVGVGARQLKATGGDGQVAAFSGGGKLGLAILQDHGIADEGADGGCACEGGGGAAVIRLVAGVQARHGQGPGADAGRGGGLTGDGVVAHICTAVGAGQSHGLGVARIFVIGRVARVAEVAGGTDGDGVARDQAIGLQHTVGHACGADRGGGQAVVDLVGGGDAGDGQGFGGDGAGAVAGIAQAVVLAAVAVADGGGAEAHHFAAISGTFVVKGHGGGAHAVTTHAELVAQCAQVAGAGRVVGVAVIDLADHGGGQGHRLGRNGHSRIGGAQRVVVAAQTPIAGSAQTQPRQAGQELGELHIFRGQIAISPIAGHVEGFAIDAAGR